MNCASSAIVKAAVLGKKSGYSFKIAVIHTLDIVFKNHYKSPSFV